MNGQMLGLSRLVLLARDQPPDPERGRASCTARRGTPYVAIIDRRAARVRARAAARHRTSWPACSRSARCSRSRSRTCRSIVLRFREPDRPSAFRVPLSIRGRRARACRCRRCSGRWSSIAGLDQRARAARGRALSRRRLDGRRDHALRRSTGASQGKSLTQRFTIPAEALQEAPEVEYGSILVPVFGEHARRRHRRHRRPARRRGRRGGRGRRRASRRSTCSRSRCRCRSTRACRTSAIDEAQAARSRAPRRWARSTRAWRWRPPMVRGALGRAGDRRGGAPPRRRGDRAGRRGAHARARRRDRWAAAAARATASWARPPATWSRRRRAG